MNTFHRFKLPLTLVAVFVVRILPGFGTLIVNDDFESTAVGSTPANWTDTINALYVTNGIAGHAGKVLFFKFLNEPGNSAFRNLSPNLTFDYHLGMTVEVSYDLMVSAIPGDNTDGFVNRLDDTAAPNDFGQYRLIAPSSPATYALANVAGTPKTNGLSTGVWYNVRIDTLLYNGGSNAVSTFYLNGSLFFSNNVNQITAGTFGRTNDSYLEWFSENSGNVQFFVDNLAIQQVPEPSAVLLGLGGLLLLRRKRSVE